MAGLCNLLTCFQQHSFVRVAVGIPCNCGRIYIGKIGVYLSVRIQEHKRAVRTLDTRNALATHIMEHPDYCVEGISIKMTKNNLNTDRGLTINPISQ